MYFSLLFLLSSLLATTHSHGIIISPPPRSIGPASLSACGESVTSLLKTDNQTGIEALHEAAVLSSDFKKGECNLSLCKGLQIADNLHNVQKWVAGQEVVVKIWERIPHTGWASLAIIDTKSMFVVGEELVTFRTRSMSGYSMTDREIVVKIPKVYPKCMTPGECVLQWTWFGRVVKQTYESCIDFTIAPETYGAGDGGWDEENDQKIMVDEIGF